jgi:5-methylcytosine-specific restriction enzyme subunit McrC
MYDEEKRPFFKPTRNGIRFCEWVGVIKVLDLTVEILPKADKLNDFDTKEAQVKEQNKWQSILIDMLKVCHSLDTPSVSDASLKLKSNSILDLYIQRFINEVNYLINAGLIKKYRKEEINSTALKGKLLLQKHITKNIVHKERFYVSRTTYDRDHKWHQILFKAIQLLPLICNNQYLVSLCYQLQLNFPEVKDIKVDASLFDNLVYDRKSEPYKPAIQIAKLFLLNYRPDVSFGSTHSIAILFDMNKLWEEYIYRMLQKANKGRCVVHNQRSTKFWNFDNTNRYLKPDIVLQKEIGNDELGNPKYEYIVIDTKWKNIYDDVKNIAMEDLRQMFAYHHYFDASKCYLLYPGTPKKPNDNHGTFTNSTYFKENKLAEIDKKCGVIISQAWLKNEESKSYLDKNIGVTILKELGIIQLHVDKSA